jgi:hypothetical protein
MAVTMAMPVVWVSMWMVDWYPRMLVVMQMRIVSTLLEGDRGQRQSILCLSPLFRSQSRSMYRWLFWGMRIERKMPRLGLAVVLGNPLVGNGRLVGPEQSLLSKGAFLWR